MVVPFMSDVPAGVNDMSVCTRPGSRSSFCSRRFWMANALSAGGSLMLNNIFCSGSAGLETARLAVRIRRKTDNIWMVLSVSLAGLSLSVATDFIYASILLSSQKCQSETKQSDINGLSLSLVLYCRQTGKLSRK